MAVQQQTFKLDIVSPEGSIYSGDADMLLIKGGDGDLGITPGHLQLLTNIAPGAVRIKHGDEEELLFISGGILEVQPYVVSILADTVVRPQDVNETAALEAKQAAEKALKDKSTDADYHKTMQDLQEAMAKLRVVEMAREHRKRR